MMGSEKIICPENNRLTRENEYINCRMGVKDDESPIHRARIESFYMQTTEVTQEQYYKIMGKNPSKFNKKKLRKETKNYPVESVSWYDAKKFVKKLNKMENTNKYSLPTESQWEYAIRAGKKTKWYFGNTAYDLVKFAWYSKNSSKQTNIVATKEPNPWGLYDMYGNVYEWIEDDYAYNYEKAPRNGNAYKAKGSRYKVKRGGSWKTKKDDMTSSYRNASVPKFRSYIGGFRVARIK